MSLSSQLSALNSGASRTRRISTLKFARLVAPHLESRDEFLSALDNPLITDIADTMDAHQGARFFILGPVQVFKSLLGQLHLARNHWIRPARAGWYCPTKDFARSFADEKLNLLLAAAFDNPASPFHGITLADRTPQKFYHRYLTGSHLILSAETENDRTGKTLRDIYIDEPHRYEPGWLKQISNRRKFYEETADWIEVLMSTGLTRGGTGTDTGPRGSEATTLWEQTDQRTWHVRCPHCKKYYEPRYTHREKEDDPESPIIGGLIYEKHFLENGLPNEVAIGNSLAYKCPRCGFLLPDRQTSRVALSGSAKKPLGIYVAQNATATPRSFGWRFTSIAIRPWLPIVIAFEKAQLARRRGDLEELAKWIREEMAGIWDPEKYLRAQNTLPTGDYDLGQDWDGEALDPQGRPVRCLTVDVQMDHFVLVIRMWGRSGSRLRWCDKVTSPGRLRDLQLEHNVISDRVYLDGRHDTEYVRRIAAQFGWRVLMGDKDQGDYLHPDTGLRRIYSPPRLIDAYQGTLHAGQYPRIAEFNFNKQKVLSRLHLLRTTLGADDKPTFTAARNVPAWYRKETSAHYRVKKTTPNGEIYYVWQGLHADHADDCEAEQVVFASMAGLIGAESIETVATDRPKAES